MPHLALLSLALLISLLRLHYYDWPPNRDVTTYATIAHELVLGKQLYIDVWDHKPPAVYFTYWISEKLFGYGPAGLYGINLLAALIILAGVYRAGIVSGLGVSAGLWAAVFWAALSGDVLFQTHDPNAEAFMNACLIWSFVFFLRSETAGLYRRAVAAGFFFLSASLYKYVVITVPAALGAVHLLSPPPRMARHRAFSQILIIVAVGCLGWTAVTAYFFSTGRFAAFFRALFEFNSMYAGNIWANLFRGFTLQPVFGKAWVPRLAVPLVCVILSAGLIVWDRKRRREWSLLVAYLVGAFAAVSLPGKFYAHYFQLMLPPIAVAAGWAIAVFRLELPRRIQWAPLAVGVVLLLGIAFHEQVYYRSSPEELLPGSYAELYLTTQKLGGKLGDLLEPGETLFQWGEESGLYYYSRKRPISTVLCWPSLTKSFGQPFTRKILDDLNAHPPDLFIAARYFIGWDPAHPVLQWMEPRYQRVRVGDERTDHYFELWVRKGSALEARQSEWTGLL
jgi:4-amino-4-deoxy-L-arabinose transferase-like glycosyltransferase